MAELANSLVAFSDSAAQLVESAASSIVAVRGGGRWPSSGVHWRPGVIVTAEETLEGDGQITLILPGGREIEASLAGRDPTTDLVALRVEGWSGAAVTELPRSVQPGVRVGTLAIAIGRPGREPVAALGLVHATGGEWRTWRACYATRWS